MDAGGVEFTNQTVFAINVTLQSAELKDGTNYSVTVVYDQPEGQLQRNATSNPVEACLSYSMRPKQVTVMRETLNNAICFLVITLNHFP